MGTEFLEMVKIVGGIGAAGLVFLMFYLYHKSSSEQMKEIIDNNFKILNALIEQNALILGYMQEIKAAVYNNLWCPYVKRVARDKNDK